MLVPNVVGVHRFAQRQRQEKCYHRWILLEAFIYILQKIYNQWHDLEQFWAECYQIANASNRPLLSIFHEHFFALHPETPARTFKHISNPEKGSTCKRSEERRVGKEGGYR